MLAMGRTRCGNRDWVSFQQADALDLPVADSRFDVAVSVQVYEYVQEVDRALVEMHRVLKPGGRCHININRSRLI